MVDSTHPSTVTRPLGDQQVGPKELPPMAQLHSAPPAAPPSTHRDYSPVAVRSLSAMPPSHARRAPSHPCPCATGLAVAGCSLCPGGGRSQEEVAPARGHQLGRKVGGHPARRPTEPLEEALQRHGGWQYLEDEMLHGLGSVAQHGDQLTHTRRANPKMVRPIALCARFGALRGLMGMRM